MDSGGRDEWVQACGKVLEKQGGGQGSLALCGEMFDRMEERGGEETKRDEKRIGEVR